ncbi:MAG: flagellin hook IN motif-containing protein [Planctomycetota bacterium]
MALLPVSTVRTSTPLSTQRLLQQLNADQLALQRHYDQISTGRRVLSLADDPAAAGRILTLNRDIDRGEQLVRNASATETYYNAADTALARVDDALIQARAVAVSAAQTIISDDERAAFDATVQEAIQSVYTSANSLYRDHQLLGGVLGDSQPYAFDGNEIVYSGSGAVGKTDIGAGDPVALNVSGNQALGSASEIFQGEALGASVDRDSRLVDLRGGLGVQAGVLKISGGGNFIDVDLRGAFTMGDVVDLLSEVEIEGRQLTASILPDGIRLGYADGLAGTLAVDDQIGSQMAQQMAISNPTGIKPPPLEGDRLTPRLTGNTKIEDLRGGAGLDLTGGIRIDQGNKTFDISLDDVQTIGDVLIAINRSGADVRAELNETEGRIRLRSLRSGVDYSIGENGGDAATQLGIRSADENTALAELGKGRGMRLNAGGDDLIIRRPDGVELGINLDDADNIQDVIQAIRNHPANQDTAKVLVDLNDFGNGLQLKAPPGAEALQVRQIGLSDAGIRLGLIAAGDNEAVGSLVGAVDTIIGKDYVPKDAGGALDTLLRMRRAVADGDIPEIERLQAKLDDDLDRASRARGTVGVWGRNLIEMRETTLERDIAMKASRSEEMDADLAKVISDVSQRQLALEASMRLIGQTAQLTVLNYL